MFGGCVWGSDLGTREDGRFITFGSGLGAVSESGSEHWLVIYPT